MSNPTGSAQNKKIVSRIEWSQECSLSIVWNNLTGFVNREDTWIWFGTSKYSSNGSWYSSSRVSFYLHPFFDQRHFADQQSILWSPDSFCVHYRFAYLVHSCGKNDFFRFGFSNTGITLTSLFLRPLVVFSQSWLYFLFWLGTSELSSCCVIFWAL